MSADDLWPGSEPSALADLVHRPFPGVADLVDDLPVATIVVDRARGCFAVNDEFRELFRFPSPTITYADLLGIVEPADRAFDDVELRRLLDAGGAFRADRRYRRADGSRFWGNLSVRTVADEEGRPSVVIGVVVDVTDRVEAQRGLAENEARFRALVQNVGDAVIVLDERGRLVFSTPSGERLTGNRLEDVAGHDIFGFVHPDDRAVVARSFAGIVEGQVDGGPNVPLRFRLLHNDGSIRFVEAVGTNLLDEPAVGGIVVNVRDLTDSAVAQSALELTENRFRRMIENISDTVTLLDGSGRIVETTGFFGPSLAPSGSARGIGMLAADLVHPDDRDLAALGFAAVLERPGADLAGELRLAVAPGRYVDAELFAVNLLDDPDVAAIVVTARDITERKRVERELNEARDQAVQALQMRTEFIASVSHELRSPIHGVLGLSELLASSDLDPDARRLARSIGRATETLRMVLDDILDYSKIEVGRLDIELGPLDVADIGRDLVALFGAEARAKGVDLVIEAEAGFPTRVLADGLRVRQVLTNLVGNAVKFTTAGEVRARAAIVPGSELRRGGQRTTRARIEVRDTGIGIPEESRDRLFQPFSQAHRSTAREYGGTGLGLSIARRLVELMGGELGFESTPMRGSTFWFELPVQVLDPEPVDAGPAAGAAPDEPVGRHRVMVVEDNPVNQLLVRRQLERLGFDAVVFESGLAAVDGFLGAAADVVLMDWQLPGVDGIETTRRLRELERAQGRRRVPIVAMTASAMPGDRERCLAAGMDDFVAKPVSMVVLGEVIRDWVAAPLATEARRADPPDEPPDEPPGERPSAAGDSPAEPAPLAAADRHAPDAAPPGGGDPDGGRGGSGSIERAVLDDLVEDLADPELVASVVRTYLRELAPRLDALERALLAGDRAACRSVAHVLGSTSAAVGALELAARSRDVERAEPEGDPSAVVAALRAAADAVAVDLGAHLRRLAPDGAGPGPGTARPQGTAIR